MVGDEPVIIQQTKGQGKTFVHVHHNEQTALKAAKAVIRKEGGSLITLIHSGGRNIVFHLNNQRYEFDPNRIFTDKGIKKTLVQYSYYTPEAHQEVKKLADKIKALLPEGKVIAVHNNSSYSLKDYLPGHELAKDAKALYMNPDNYYRNFYLVTKLSDYLRLKMQGFNGVLQKPSATDDGSLSVYLAKRDYINVEAGYDQLAEQIKMLLHA
ncbi:protein tyrosine phosphatase [Legionella pneumophila subsp. pascullei]|nr:protein tyrosine phosphatase [Legionella pneumophila subsp. pascullei]AMP96877.1 protein tyrosine phosphatase [Legionella pneumophila subsp. pascullei]